MVFIPMLTLPITDRWKAAGPPLNGPQIWRFDCAEKAQRWQRYVNDVGRERRKPRAYR